MKKILAAILISVLGISTLSAYTYAAENTNRITAESQDSGSLIEPMYSISASSTATDTYGNKYKMTGSCTMAGKKITATTSFTISLYVNGKTTANSYTKALSAQGTASFANSATYVGTTKTQYLTGSSASLTASYSDLPYNAKTVIGNHKFSCGGGSCSSVSFKS